MGGGGGGVPFVSGYGNEYRTMKNQNQAGLKNFKPKINLNHNIYNTLVSSNSTLDSLQLVCGRGGGGGGGRVFKPKTLCGRVWMYCELA